METSSSLCATSSVTCNPLKHDSSIVALKTLEEVIRSCLGPCGKLKIIQNVAGGHVTVTSSSLRLLHIVSIKNTILRLIVSSTKLHLNYFGDGGLTCIFLVLKLINNSLSSVHFLPLIGKLFENFGKLFIDCLNVDENPCVWSMDLSNLNNLQRVVYPILQSKPGCILREDDIKYLSVLLIKIYLNTIPTTAPIIKYKNFNFVTLEGTSCAESRLLEGLLIKISDIPLKSNFENEPDMKIVLLTTSLSGDADFPVDKIEVHEVCIWEAVLKFLTCFVQKIIEAEVHVLACQKVVHPSLRKQLENANVLVLDRLGIEVSKNLEYVTGSSNSSVFDEISIGSLTCIRKETVGKSEFLLLSNKLRPFSTMLICNFNEQAANETKIVCQQVIDALFRLLKKPMVCYGAGCTEIYTCRLLEKKVIDSLDDIKREIGCTTSQVLEILQIFVKSINDLAVGFHQDSSLNFVSETMYNHLWKIRDGNFPSPNDKCACGQFTALLVNDSSWHFLSKTLSDLVLHCNASSKGIEENINKSVILDELSAKTNAFSVAFETASLLLRTSVCICS